MTRTERHREKVKRNMRQALANVPTPPPARRDALEIALANTPMAITNETSDPINDQMNWLTPEQYAIEKVVKLALRAYEDGIWPEENELGQFRLEGRMATFRDGSRIDLMELRELQHKNSYDLLRKGLDVRTVAAMVRRPESFVEKIRSDFNL